MSLLSKVRGLWQSPSPRELEALAKTIADRCEPAVWDRASRRALTMSPAEARGYIRARSAPVVAIQVARALQLRWRTEPRLYELLLESVKNETVRQIHLRLLNIRHGVVERRKAA